MGLSTTYTKTETDFLIQQLEKKTGLYNDETLAGDIIQRIDLNSGRTITYKKSNKCHLPICYNSTKYCKKYVKRGVLYSYFWRYRAS